MERTKIVDRKELIEVLEHCMKDDCNGCPNRYSDGRVACDAYMHGIGISCMPVAEIQNAIDMLKEQEPKTVLHMEKRSVIPVKTLSGFCPKCNHVLMYGMNKHFCGNCGKAVKWDEL